MPYAQKLPRKYLSLTQEAQEDLRTIGQKARRILERLEEPRVDAEAINSALREIESNAYRIALSLTELRFTDDCTGCPCAPSSTTAHVHLLVLAGELERQAMLARQMANPGTGRETELDDSVSVALVEQVSEFMHVEFPLPGIDG